MRKEFAPERVQKGLVKPEKILENLKNVWIKLSESFWRKYEHFEEDSEKILK